MIGRLLLAVTVAIGVVLGGSVLVRAEGEGADKIAGWVDGPASRPANHGPDTVILKELVHQYEAVPFDHKGHAQMAEMWDGCKTCHHRTPQATTKPATTLNGHKEQEQAAIVPACKSCHAVSGEEADIRMPNLKGAYHRQCLNCHKEWMHDNACQVCHRERGAVAATAPAPTPDDIVGRMHPPIPEPENITYTARFEPAVGKRVLFRHKEHVDFGLKCVNCHRRDNCASCHEGTEKAAENVSPLKPGRTWRDSHAPCVSCHQNDRCAHCHYHDDQTAPPPFEHSMTGQKLDKDHAGLQCRQCHATPRSKINLSCGGAACHAEKPAIAFPAFRPGPVVATRPTTTSRPATRPSSERQITEVR